MIENLQKQERKRKKERMRKKKKKDRVDATFMSTKRTSIMAKDQKFT